MEKQIITWSYWVGLLSSLIALVLRFLNLLGILNATVLDQGRNLSYNSFFRAAVLFFLLAIATASYSWVRGEKT